MYPGTHAKTKPDSPAVVMAATGESLSYRQLDQRSNQFAHLLHKLGLGMGDHIAILAENHLRYFEVYWAAMRSGLYLTAINQTLSPDEVLYLVNDSDAKAFVTTVGSAATAAAIIDQIPDCPHRFMIDGAIEGYESYEAAIASMPVEARSEEPAGELMLYSSGTTGRPKGIRRPLSGLPVDSPDRVSISMFQRFILGMDEASIYLCPAPLYHAAPLHWSCGIHDLGGTVIVMDSFDAETYLATVERYQVNSSQLVPTMFVRMLKLPVEVRNRYDVSSMQMAIHAAAPCPIEIKEKMIEWWGPVIHEYYTGTEANGLCYVNTADWLQHKGTVGKALRGIPHICDEDGNELPAGVPGTIYFEREEKAFEYHNDPEKTAAVQHPDHPFWTKLGDIGYLDDDGFLYLTDRADFTIISGGVNVYPQETENALVIHPKVADVAVFGVPNPDFGEEVKAVVQPITMPSDSAEAAALENELIDYCRSRLSAIKTPRSIDFRSELPRTETGKLVKRTLKDEYWAEPV